jgi:arylsulfatase A-like enzyme
MLSSALARAAGCHPAVRRAINYHDLLNRRDATDITNAFLDWQNERTDRPWFAFLNYYDAHEPLWPPADPDADAVYEHRCTAATGADAHIDKDALDAAGRIAFTKSYDAAIGRIDRQLGRLIDELAQRGVLDNTIVIIASDHGEQLGERELFHHNNSLYMPVLHVPLVVRYPPAVPRGARVADVATLRDLPATIMDLLAGDTAAFPGMSWARLWRETETVGAGVGPNPAASGVDTDVALAHLARGIVQKPWYPIGRGPHMFSITHDGMHYILNGDRSEELYDLATDPQEVNSLIGTARGDSIRDRMREKMQQLIVRPTR